MVKCPNCSSVLIEKSGPKKFSAQIGNPEIAIVETQSPHFCGGCNEYFLGTKEVVSAIMQIKNSSSGVTAISKGIYR